MRVMTTVVPSAGQGELRADAERIEVACQVIASATVDLIVFPAGLLRAPSEGRVMKIVAPLLAAAKAAKVAIQVGVDCDSFARARKGPLPFFLVAWSPEDGAQVWRQRARRPGDEVPPKLLDEPRVLNVGGLRIAPIACGEIYIQSIRAGIAALKPSLATLSAHFAAGSRHWAPQECLQRLGVPSVRSAHASSGTREVLVSRDGVVEPEAEVAVRGVFMNVYDLGRKGRRRAA